MEDIDASLPRSDGLRCFNYLYRIITLEVEEQLNDDKFEDEVFLRRLDVEFANLYFDALRAWGHGELDKVPRVWKALLERRGDLELAPVQFAIAGVNAHINRDLSLAVVRTCAYLRIGFDLGSQRVDYDHINEIFHDKYAGLREYYTGDAFDAIDEGVLENAFDLANSFVVGQARDWAWRSARDICRFQDVGDTEGALRVTERLDEGASRLAANLFLRRYFRL